MSIVGKSQSGTSVRGAGVKAVSPAERGRGAKRRALTSVSQRTLLA